METGNRETETGNRESGIERRFMHGVLAQKIVQFIKFYYKIVGIRHVFE